MPASHVSAPQVKGRVAGEDIFVGLRSGAARMEQIASSFEESPRQKDGNRMFSLQHKRGRGTMAVWESPCL